MKLLIDKCQYCSRMMKSRPLQQTRQQFCLKNGSLNLLCRMFYSSTNNFSQKLSTTYRAHELSVTKTFQVCEASLGDFSSQHKSILQEEMSGGNSIRNPAGQGSSLAAPKRVRRKKSPASAVPTGCRVRLPKAQLTTGFQ